MTSRRSVLDRFLLLRLCIYACAGITGCAQTLTLPYRPVTAEYSNALDRIIFIAAAPNQLHIFDPMTSSDTTVNLPKSPLSLSVSLDGLHAAVGHDALISYVNLQTASLQQTLPATVTVTNLALGTDYVYVMTYSGGTQSIRISDGATSSNGVYNGTAGRLHPSGTALYTTEDGLSPEHLQDLNVSTGPVTAVYGGPYHGDFAVCGGVWFSPDGRRVYTGCATAYQAAPQKTGLGLIFGTTGPLDTTSDELYWGSFPGLNLIRSLSESAPLGRIAAVPSSYAYSTAPVKDNQVFLYDSAYFEPAGTYQLPDFTVNGKAYQAHGQQVFYNKASTALYVVMQADGGSGLLNDFAVQIYRLDNPPVCSPTFTAANTTVAASGTVATVGITAPATCTYQASSNSSWIRLISGAYGSGNGTLTYIVRPNSGIDRTGTISVAGQTFTVSQSGASGGPGLKQLSYSVIAAEYSKALDKVVFITPIPKELHIYDPNSGSDQAVLLPKTPFSVSVSPDGMSAAVGFDSWVSIVNLTTAAVTSTVHVYTDVHSILLGGNGYFYAYPQNTWGDLFSGQISTSIINLANAIYTGRYPRLYADGNTFYTEGSKWDISQGPAKNISSNYSGGCTPFWLTEDGARMITACGKAYMTSPVASLDLQYNGSFSNANSIQWAAESAKLHSTVVIPSVGYQSNGTEDTYVQVYGDTYLGYSGELSLPTFAVGAKSYAGRGRYVFFNNAADKLVLVEQADSTAALAADYGVSVLSLTTPAAGCSFTLGATSAQEPSDGGLDSATVTTGDGCIWEAVSNAPWITVNSGAVGFGSGEVIFTFAANPNVSSRSGTVTIARQTFTISQLGKGSLSTAVLAIHMTHSGDFTLGQQNATYQVTITNTGMAPTNAVVTVTETVPAGLTLVSMSGAGWTCPGTAANNCKRSDAVNAGSSYPPITVTVNVAANATSPLINIASVNGGGAAAASTTDWTVVSGAAPSGLGFFPLTPCRVVDTRPSQGKPAGFGAPALMAYQNRDFSILSGSCGVSYLAQAYSLNFTVTPPGPLDFLSVWPAGQSYPGVSTLNSPDGSTIANAAVVPAGTNGGITAAAGQGTDLIIDINGYFGPQNGYDLAFYPVTPCRVADTRNGQGKSGQFGPPALKGYETRDFSIPASNCNIPSSAKAYSLNMTAVPAGRLEFLSTWPAGQAYPGVSTLNATDGSVVANAALVPAGTNGAITVVAGNPTDLIIDINGYFGPPGAQGALHFYPLSPCRVVDTRPGQGKSGAFGPPGLAAYTNRDFPLSASNCNIPAMAQAYSLNFTVVPQGRLDFLSSWPADSAYPGVSTLNSPKGTIIANAAIVPAGTNGAITVVAGNPTDLIIDINGYFAP